MLLLPLTIYGGGYLGKSNNIQVYANEYLTNGNISLEYQRILARSFSLTYNMSYLNNSFAEDSSFSLLRREGDIKVKGIEYQFGLLFGSFSVNNVLPLGISNGIKFGGGRYTTGNSEFEDTYTIISFAYVTRGTFNIYKNLNGFVGIDIGVYSPIGDSLDPSPDEFGDYYGQRNPYYLVRKGLNKNYRLSYATHDNQNERAAFLFNFSYGLTYIFGK